MPYIQKIADFIDPKWVQSLLLVWLIFLPFGTFLGSYSLGAFTVYPSFVLLVVLFVLVLPSIIVWDKKLIYFALFLLLWFIYSVFAPFFLGFEVNDNWKFDIRSLLLQFLYFVVLIGSYYKLGKSSYSIVLKNGLIFFFVVLVVDGVFEYYTGIHIRGHYTDKLLTESRVSENFYAPVFIYDNPNDYLVYYFGILSLYLLLVKSSFWKTIALIGLGFLFALMAGSRLAMMLSLLLGAIYSVSYLRCYFHQYKIVSSAIILVFFCFLLNPVFIGPKYRKGEFTISNKYVEYPKSEQGELSSINVRKNLLLNGVDFVKESPITGIGPGQFRERHQNGLVNHNTGTVVGPHNYLVEIITQYGVFAWFYIGVLGLVFIHEMKRGVKSKEWTSRFMLLPVFGILSIAPSGFLYLDVNWIIVSISLLFIIEFKKQHNE